MPETAVLLATYNGASFLGDQLDSLRKQIYRDFLLLARDDGSRDSSLSLLAEFCKYSDGITCGLLDSGGSNLGACQSFGHLLEHALAQHTDVKYFAFCDQDDWWLPGKLESLTAEMRRQEALNPRTPIMVRSDVAVVDANLQTIAPSYWRKQRLDPSERRLTRLVLRNTTVGCSMMINRELAALASPFPREAVMHDWWITLVAAAVGQIGSLSSSLVLYRQHSSNALGVGVPGFMRVLSPRHWRERILNTHDWSAGRPFEQADALRKRLSGRVSGGNGKALDQIADFAEFSGWKKRYRMIRAGIFPRDPVRFAGMMIKL